MTYLLPVPLTSDEQYFTDLGLLTGMSKIIDATGGNTFPTGDATYGTAAVITNNVLKWGAASAPSWVGYNLGATYDKVLMLDYTIPSTGSNIYPCVISKNVLDASNAWVSDDFYMTNQTFATQIWKRTSGTWTMIGADTTIYSGVLATTPAFGTALYVEDGVQRMFMKFGSTSEWVQIFSLTDPDSTSFQSVALWTHAVNQRCTTPLIVWGA